MTNGPSLRRSAVATISLLSQMVGQVETVPTWQRLDLPSLRGAMAPEVTATDDGALLTWLQPIGDAPRATFALQVARYRGGRFDEPVRVTEGNTLFVNWADFPSAVVAGDGSLLVHWLRRGGSHQYGIELARRPADGLQFTALGHPHRVGIRGEHGFVSLLAEGAGARAFWIDGRHYEAHRRMELRSTKIVGDRLGDEEVLDPNVCTCCQTAAVMTAKGPLVVYRGHTDSEVRDILIVRREGDGWTKPRTVADDGWVIPGCPVNGPAVAATAEQVAVLWYTGAKNGAGVKIAFSDDAGATLAPPQWVDRGAPLGRVDVAATDRGFLLTWLAVAGDAAAVRTQEWSGNEPLGPTRDVASVPATRDSGFPRVAAVPGGTLLVWTEGTGICAALLTR